MNVLVTGGAGYIGSHTAVELIKAGHRVIIVDDLSNAKEAVVDRIETITGTRPAFYKTDCKDADAISNLFAAEKIDAVIGCSFMGLSAVPNESERFLGMQGMHGHYASSMSQNEADLILAVGVRFSDRATGNVSKFAKKSRIIQIDPDCAEINKNVRVDLGLVGDVENAFKRIAEKCQAKSNPEWIDRVRALKAEEKGFEEEIAAKKLET